jgi:hypothetical protein
MMTNARLLRTTRRDPASAAKLICAVGRAVGMSGAISQAFGGNTKSTVGAAGGALLGAAMGTATTPKRQGDEFCRCRASDGRVYEAPCDDRYYNDGY